MSSIKVYPQNCKQHTQDFDIIMSRVDDVGAAALALATNGAQGYTQFIESRENFKLMVKEIARNYRYVKVEGDD
jgi:hypothetical protein